MHVYCFLDQMQYGQQRYLHNNCVREPSGVLSEKCRGMPPKCGVPYGSACYRFRYHSLTDRTDTILDTALGARGRLQFYELKKIIMGAYGGSREPVSISELGITDMIYTPECVMCACVCEWEDAFISRVWYGFDVLCGECVNGKVPSHSTLPREAEVAGAVGFVDSVMREFAPKTHPDECGRQRPPRVDIRYTKRRARLPYWDMAIGASDYTAYSLAQYANELIAS